MRWRGEGKCEQQLLSFSVLHVLFAPSVPYHNSGPQHASVSLGGRAVNCSTAWRFGHWPRWRSCYNRSPYIPPPSQSSWETFKQACFPHGSTSSHSSGRFMFSVEFLNVILVCKKQTSICRSGGIPECFPLALLTRPPVFSQTSIDHCFLFA